MSRNNELIAAYLDDSLTDEQAAELELWLNADAANMRQFVLANARDEQLREAVTANIPNRHIAANKPCTSGVVRRRLQATAIVSCTAAVLITVTAWLVVQQPDRAELVTLVEMNGAVSLRNDDNNIVRNLEVGAQLSVGTLVLEGESSAAQFMFADNSTLSLSGDAELKIHEGIGKQLYLQSGTLLASVSRQPVGRPLRVRTPTAEAVVLGTSFTMNAAIAETFLRVNSGTVELHRLADDQSLKVSEREQARATVDATQPMQPEPVEPLPATWVASLESAQIESWTGHWSDDEILVAIPRTVFIREAGIRENHFHAGATNGFPGLVTLREASAVRVRFRTQRPLNVGIFVVTHTESGAFSGNFQAYIQQRITPPDADGWRTATVPLASFIPIQGSSHSFTSGCVASTLFVTTYTADVGLEVAEFEVLSIGSDQ